MGLLALSKKGNKAALALAFLCFSATFWSLELFLLTYLEDPRLLDTWFHLTRVGMFLIPPSLALLVSQLVRAPSKYFQRFVLIPGFSIALMQGALNNTLYPSTLRPAIGGYLPTVDWIYYSFIVNFTLCFIGSIVLSGLVYNSSPSRDKQRIKWLLIIVIVTSISGAFSLYLVAYDFYLSKFIGSFTNALFMLLLFYATVQHHLVDVRLAATMALSRIVLLTAFAGVYMGLGYSMQGFANDLGSLLVFALLLVLALELYPRAVRWLEPNTKRLLLASNYEYKEVASAIGADLKRCTNYNDLSKLLDYLFYRVIRVKSYHLYLVSPAADPKQVLARSVNGTKQEFGVSYESLQLLEPHLRSSSVIMVDEMQADIQQKMTTLSADCVLPMRRGSELQAIVVVGRSAVHSYYRYDDIRLMEWLTGELSQTLYRIFISDKLDSELAEAKKKLSMLSVMNLYHHDIKAPLSIIDGVVSNDLYDDEKRRSIILEQVAWGSQLITTMAQLLKADRKRRTSPIVLQKVLDDCSFVFKRSIKHLTVEHAGDFTVQADPDDLKILFINVIKNAVEAARPDSTFELAIKSWATQESVYVTLTDNGVGMTQEQLDGLWLNLESTKQGGNGIGLQAIKKIADEHGATIEVTSAPGKGSTFMFEFVRQDADLDALVDPETSLA